jgi:hypothetical protein
MRPSSQWFCRIILNEGTDGHVYHQAVSIQALKLKLSSFITQTKGMCMTAKRVNHETAAAAGLHTLVGSLLMDSSSRDTLIVIASVPMTATAGPGLDSDFTFFLEKFKRMPRKER